MAGRPSSAADRSPGAPRVPARERLLGAAAELFYAHGVAATGIETVIAEAGVARMSLYNNFASKEELVLAHLRARHEEWLGLYRRRLAAAGDPAARVGAVFDAYVDHAEKAYRHGFRGCGLLNAAAELPTGSPGRELVRRHKEEVQALLEGHLLEAGLPPGTCTATAEHLSFLLEGAMARGGLEGDPQRLHHAREIAARLVGPLTAGTTA
ncbi:TetR/AcrR family transcriptional regulator [Kineococcus sp. G2]|uniref:TetR/AcrR family transcriptional regulator n=1 Tax=Kineococcus sp. G2 TaxID=3127484 RepID=UPI00301CFEE2